MGHPSWRSGSTARCRVTRASLADRHGLGALDAIHLASALSIATPARPSDLRHLRPAAARGRARRGADGPARGRVGARGRHARPHRRRPAPVPARPPRDRRLGPRAGSAGGAPGGYDRHRRGGAGKEPADPVRQRPRGADAPADARIVAPLPAGRALASRPRPGAARDRGPGLGRGVLRRPDGRAVRAAGRRVAPGAEPPRAGPAQGPVRRRRGAAAAAGPVPVGAVDRGGAPGPARARRHRQRGEERGPVAGPGVTVDAGPRPGRRRAATSW